ncbi:LrgB family protein [Advenella mimigardefordensis]|uniref:Putative LrgB-like protein n=1 Tax=Advenella mimigardefordensis (strain DSM 17166 / LMG 22922 / DPN7) TaxID=1247726 RepID=W0PCH9_ADVMD|nr:LrgB family protein [Advenella mimigardefordensis]AHG64594.1 putative LrgB-like protein [Advenella mimigardefordensis DPN7]
MSEEMIGLASLLVTVACYWLNKRLYRRFPNPFLMPLLATPLVLIVLAIWGQVSYVQYISLTHWLVWLLGPATIAFAIPLYENRALLRKHGMSIATGVVVASLVSVCSSVWLAQAFGLSQALQKGLAVRSVTTPFALEAEKVLGGSPDLASLFVLLTGVSGMFMGDLILRLLPRVRSKLAAGAIFGGGAHGSGVAKARQFGEVQAVVASLVMMIAGALNVLLAPVVRILFF